MTASLRQLQRKLGSNVKIVMDGTGCVSLSGAIQTAQRHELIASGIVVEKSVLHNSKRFPVAGAETKDCFQHKPRACRPAMGKPDASASARDAIVDPRCICNIRDLAKSGYVRGLPGRDPGY